MNHARRVREHIYDVTAMWCRNKAKANNPGMDGILIPGFFVTWNVAGSRDPELRDPGIYSASSANSVELKLFLFLIPIQ